MLTCQQCGKKKDQKARLSGTSVSTGVESQSSSVEVFNPLREDHSAAALRMFGNRGAKSSPTKPNPSPNQDSPPISAEAASVLLQLSKLSLEQQQQVIRMTSGVNVTPQQKPEKASGLYQDPRTGKQYRLKKPKRRSKAFQQAETLVKTALAELQEWTHTNGCTFAREDKSLLKDAKPFTPTGKALEEYDLLLHALGNARKQLKAVKETEKSRGPKKGKSLDPKRMPVFKPDTRSWADLEEDK